MRNKKLIKALATLTLSAAAAGCFTLFGCGHTHEFDSDWSYNSTGHWHEVLCGHDEAKTVEDHVYDDDNDIDCNICGYVRTIKGPEDENPTPSVTQYTVTYNMSGHGTQIDSVKVDENTKLTQPEAPESYGWKFVGWFTDEACTKAYNFEEKVTSDLTLYASWTQIWLYDAVNHFHANTVNGNVEITDEGEHTLNENDVCTTCGATFKQATYEFVPSDLEATTYADGTTSGIFSVLAGTTVRTRARENYSVYDYNNGYYGDSEADPVETGFTASKSVQYNGEKRGIGVNAIAPGVLTIYVDNGSSGKTSSDLQSILLTRPDGTSETIYYCCIGLYAISIECDQVGTYTITRGKADGVGTTDLYYAKYVTKVPVTNVEKIEIIEKGNVRFLLNEEFDYSKLQVQIVRETTGMLEPVDLQDLDIDYSAFDNTKAGTYTIVVTYTDENNKKFTADYTVKVYDVEALELGFNAIIQGSNTSYGNGTYVNHTVQQFYFKGEQLNLDGLTIKTVFDGGAQKVIVTEGFTVTGFDSSKAGKQTVRITWNDDEDVYAEFTVYVADYSASELQLTTETVTINVDSNFTDNKVGVLESGAYQFKTIQQALDFLEVVNIGENTKKIINLAAGTYEEKLEINVPNLTIKGADSSNPDKTVIEWDSLYGIADEGGFIHTTDSTATLNVREAAVGFVIEDVTISNWYNSTEHFDQALGANYAEHRALAMLIQADKVVIDNCRILGYQDTIELFTGRQYILNTYICGRTDFIFGTNNTTYFYNCEIESIVSGGYVTAFKGCNKGADDAITYGAIFDECKFTAPSSVTSAGDTSLGRTWGAYAAVAYVNCELGGHISTKAYGEGSGTRYTAMSGNEPTDSTVKFVEYNNTGAGALVYTAADEQKDPTHVAGTSYGVAGMRLLTAAEAANYSNMSVFFGKTNGGVTYTSTWDGSKGVEITEKTYKFTSDVIAEASLHETEADGEDIFGGDMTVYALNGAKWRPESSKSQAQFNEGCVIKFNVAGKVSVTAYGGNYGLPENVRISYENGKATITIVKTASSPIANGCYITQIVLDKSEIPAESKIVYSFVNDGGNITGTEAQPAEIFNGDITVVGYLRNNGNSYQVQDGTVLTFEEQGEVSVKWYQTYGSDENVQIVYTDGKAVATFTGSNLYIESVSVDTSYIPEDTILTKLYDADEVVDLTGCSAFEGTSGVYAGIEIDATNGKFAYNGSGWMQMNTGTVLKVEVAENISVSVVEYNNAGSVSISERDEDGFVTILATGNTYIKSIAFTIVEIYENDAIIDMTTLTTAYEGSSGSYKGVLIDATNGKFANNNSGWIQMNTGTVLKVHVGEDIKVSVVEYQDKGLVTIGERDEDGWVSITATGNTYISKINLVLPLKKITENWTYTYSQNNRTDGTLEIGTDRIKFDNCKVNNSWLMYGTITLDVAKDATITIKGSQWDKEIQINGNAIEKTVDGNYWVYTYYVPESEAGVVTISSSTGYLASITVSFGDEEE